MNFVTHVNVGYNPCIVFLENGTRRKVNTQLKHVSALHLLVDIVLDEQIVSHDFTALQPFFSTFNLLPVNFVSLSLNLFWAKDPVKDQVGVYLWHVVHLLVGLAAPRNFICNLATRRLELDLQQTSIKFPQLAVRREFVKQANKQLLKILVCQHDSAVYLTYLSKLHYLLLRVPENLL